MSGEKLASSAAASVQPVHEAKVHDLVESDPFGDDGPSPDILPRLCSLLVVGCIAYAWFFRRRKTTTRSPRDQRYLE